MNTPHTTPHTKITSEKTLTQLLELGFKKRVADNIYKYNIDIIEDTQGAKYMDKFMTEFPKNTLLDKAKTGIGATTMALRHKDKYVIAVPFRDLASNKEEWCLEERIDVLAINGDTTSEEIQSYTGNKIIVVYDSLYKVSKYIKNFESFRIMIDEAHILLLSGTFRKRAIYTVFKEYKKYKDYVFLTATIPSRMYDMDEFKNMSKAIIKWKHNPQPTFLSHIIDSYNNESLRDVLYTVCLEHLKGTRNSNAYVFINSVKAIKSLVKLLLSNEEATFNDINIIAAASNESQIETDLGKDFSIGKAPTKKGTPKKLNFVTSTGFEGQDFYDSNGKVYIVSDGSFEYMKLDLLTQVPQIVGRLRDSNLNDNIPIILVPNEVEESQTFEMFRKNLKIQLSTARKDAKERTRLFNVAKERFDGIDKLSSENFERFLKEVKDKPEYYVSDGKVSTNKLYYLTSLNKWDIKQQGFLAVYNEEVGLLQAKYSEFFEMNFKNELVHNMPVEFIKYRKGIQQPMENLISKSFELLDLWLSSDNVISTDKENISPEYYAFYVPNWIKEAYFTIGTDEMIKLRYSKTKIESFTNEYRLHKLVSDKLNLEIGEYYLNSDLKSKIQEAFDSIGISGRAKATDISLYYVVKSSMKTIKKVRKRGYLIESKIIMKNSL